MERKFARCVIALLLCVNSFIANAAQNIHLSADDILQIGVRVMYNENAGNVIQLTNWNNGEDFASVGIGHFIWFPAQKRTTDKDTFPLLVQYMQEHKVKVPSWLANPTVIKCPWRNQAEFKAQLYSPRMEELRTFLLATIRWQAQYMVDRLDRALPRMLQAVPASERPYITQQFNRLAKTSQGLYALVDYVNFKGEGINQPKDGWGLLQVLEGMKNAPASFTTLQAFAWSADRVLTHRVLYASQNKNDKRWLPGWRQRLKTYTESEA